MEEQMVDQVMIFLVVGYEMVVFIMVWVMYVFCQNFEVQWKLWKEVRERLLFVDSGKGVMSVDIEVMLYFSVVCNEVLRFYLFVFFMV